MKSSRYNVHQERFRPHSLKVERIAFTDLATERYRLGSYGENMYREHEPEIGSYVVSNSPWDEDKYVSQRKIVNIRWSDKLNGYEYGCVYIRPVSHKEIIWFSYDEIKKRTVYPVRWMPPDINSIEDGWTKRTIEEEENFLL